MATTVYHYPGCSTCRKARKWLDGQGVEAKLIDLVETPPSKTKLKKLCSRFKMKNTKVTTAT